MKHALWRGAKIRPAMRSAGFCAAIRVPAWITRATVNLHRGGTITHAVIDNAATLVYLANYNMITAHVWPSRIQTPEQPDQLIFDLDPADDDFGLVRQTALSLKTMLEM